MRAVTIPPILSPSDFHWQRSRSLNLCRGIDLQNHCIELFRSDVTKVLCGSTDGDISPGGKDGNLPGSSKQRPARQRAEEVLTQLFGDRVPDQTALPNAVLCKQVGAKLKELGYTDVSDDTILRAAGRRK
jgi:hypothetical protein